MFLSKPKKKKLNLEQLLSWAKQEQLYIEICGDGSVNIEAMRTKDGDYELLLIDDYLGTGLEKAYKLKQGKKYWYRVFRELDKNED